MKGVYKEPIKVRLLRLSSHVYNGIFGTQFVFYDARDSTLSFELTDRYSKDYD